MTAKYFLTVTQYGAKQIAQAHKDKLVQLKYLVIGDANNAPYSPMDRVDQTQLINERASIPIQDCSIINNGLRVKATIPANIGGFNLHEIGLTDDTNQIIYLGNYHGGYKPIISEGAGGELTLVIDIKTEATDVISVSIDPNVVSASKSWVADELQNFRTQFTQLKKDILESIQDIKVGDIYITTLNFENSDEVNKHKGYGRWKRLGNGHALITKGDETRPEFMRTILAEGGSDTHQLTIEELPSHDHEQEIKYSGEDGVTGNPWGSGTNEKDRYEGTFLFESGLTGKDKPHNNIQKSLTIGAWQRLPDLAPVYVLTSNQDSVSENQDVVLHLLTENLPQNTQINYSIKGLDPSSLSDVKGSFIIGEDGTATSQFYVKDLNTQPTINTIKIILDDEDISLSLTKNMPEVIFSKIYLNDYILPTLQTEDGIAVKGSVVLDELFVKQIGRSPLERENISFIVDPNIAIVGNSTSVPAIDLGSNWLSSNKITIENNGYILGRGGNSDKYRTPDADDSTIKFQDGGNAIVNNTDLSISIINNLWLAGGGGAGGYGTGGSSGAGAPYGTATSSVNSGTATATFKTPGQRKTDGSYYNGAGGNWGKNGENGTVKGLSQRKELAEGRQSGYALVGKFSVTNNGTLKGRDFPD